MGTGDMLMITFFSVFFHVTCVGVSVFPDNSDQAHDFDIEYDWREFGVITPVVNQGEMGKSMVLAKKEAVESMYAISHHTLIELSANMISDCCDKFIEIPDFNCIQKHGGLCSAKDYGKAKGFCPPIINCTRYGNISKTETLPPHNETMMKTTTRYTGPPIAYIYAGLPSFMVGIINGGPLDVGDHKMYTSGIYKDPDCTGGPLDHVVQIVGYGKETKSGTNFWIIKNTWGVNWGIGGYMYLERDTNRCGISNHVFLPVHGDR